jgi:hypothetical protein
MTIVNFPTKLPAPHQLEFPRAQLSGLLNDLNAELMQRQLDLLKAGNAVEFATAVRKAAEELAKASAGWSALANTIRESWRI